MCLIAALGIHIYRFACISDAESMIHCATKRQSKMPKRPHSDATKGQMGPKWLPPPLGDLNPKSELTPSEKH